jgi:hypothetical protein
MVSSTQQVFPSCPEIERKKQLLWAHKSQTLATWKLTPTGFQNAFYISNSPFGSGTEIVFLKNLLNWG